MVGERIYKGGVVLYEKHKNGKLSEFYVAYELTNSGFDVTFPTGNPRYDLIIENEFERYFVQVKSTYRKGEEIKVNLRGNSTTKSYAKREIDIIAIHERTGNDVFYVPIEDISGQVSICLRYKPPAKIRSHRTRMADDYKRFPHAKEDAS
jgi:hypothetical protein